MHQGEWIKLLRTKRKINQKEFAKKTKISPNYLSLIEGGKRTPSNNYLKQAANTLEVPVNLFLWEKVNFTKFTDPDTRKLAKKIDESLKEIKLMLTKKLL